VEEVEGEVEVVAEDEVDAAEEETATQSGIRVRGEGGTLERGRKR
jgi:hypothetical protein